MRCDLSDRLLLWVIKVKSRDAPDDQKLRYAGSAALPPVAHAAATAREIRTGKVTACSAYGPDCYTAALVRSPVGWKMRLRGGTLIDCGVTCEEELRRKTVDFWRDLQERRR